MNYNTFLMQAKPKNKIAFPCLCVSVSHIFHSKCIHASSTKGRIKIKLHWVGFFNIWKKVKKHSKIGTLPLVPAVLHPLFDYTILNGNT